MKKCCPRVVLDTNCLVSALLFSHGTMGQLRTFWQRKVFIPLLCTSTTKELIRVLAYPKFRLSPEDIQDLLGDILPWAEVKELHMSPSDLPYLEHLRDPKDEDFILLAEQEHVECLVSGDKHLLELKNFAHVAIMQASEFLQILGNDKLTDNEK